MIAALAATLALLGGEPSVLSARSHDGRSTARGVNTEGLGREPCALVVEKNGGPLWTHELPVNCRELAVTDRGEVLAITAMVARGVLGDSQAVTVGGWVLVDERGELRSVFDLPRSEFDTPLEQFVLDDARVAFLRTRRKDATDGSEVWWKLALDAPSRPEAIRLPIPAELAAYDTRLDIIERIPGHAAFLCVWQGETDSSRDPAVLEVRSLDLSVTHARSLTESPYSKLRSLSRAAVELHGVSGPQRYRLPDLERIAVPPRAPKQDREITELDLTRSVEFGTPEERARLPAVAWGRVAWSSDAGYEGVGQVQRFGGFVRARFDAQGVCTAWSELQPDREGDHGDWRLLDDGTWVGVQRQRKFTRIARLRPGANAIESLDFLGLAEDLQLEAAPGARFAVLHERIDRSWELSLWAISGRKAWTVQIAPPKSEVRASLAVRADGTIGVLQGNRLTAFDWNGQRAREIELAPAVIDAKAKLLAAGAAWWLRLEAELARIDDAGVAVERLACPAGAWPVFDPTGEPWAGESSRPHAPPRTWRALRDERRFSLAAAGWTDARPIDVPWLAELDGHGRLWWCDAFADSLQAFDASGARVACVPIPADENVVPWRMPVVLGERLCLFDVAREARGPALNLATLEFAASDKPRGGSATSADGVREVTWTNHGFEIRERSGLLAASVKRDPYGERFHKLHAVEFVDSAHVLATWTRPPHHHWQRVLEYGVWSVDGQPISLGNEPRPGSSRWALDIDDRGRLFEAIVQRRSDGARFRAPIPQPVGGETMISSGAWIAPGERELWVLDRPARALRVYALPAPGLAPPTPREDSERR